MKSIFPIIALMVFAVSAKAQKQIQITWLGHAAFEIVSPGGTTILIDPFLKQNPATPAARKDLTAYKPNAILITHSHFDHAADVVEIARGSKADVIGEFEYVSDLAIPDDQKKGGNVGGKFTVGDVTVHMVPAMHSSIPSGRPVGFVIRFADGRTLYHSGDTWIFGDMALIQELYKPSIILLTVGGGPFTQDPQTAALAVRKYFTPDAIVPMHYGTWPPLAQEADVRKAFEGMKNVVILKPGEQRAYESQ
jgi:L-ascorbate metabolism protein UlaG (beta-lactamase superfamily)